MLIKKICSKEFLFLRNAAESMLNDVALSTGKIPAELGHMAREGTVVLCKQALFCCAVKKNTRLGGNGRLIYIL